MSNTVDLQEKKQFRVMLNPVRQEMIHRLRLWGRPITASALAEQLQLSPSAAQSHLKKLVDLGLVSMETRERRGGGTVVVYQARDVRLRLCLGRRDPYQGEREALAANLVDGTFRSLLSATYRHDERELKDYALLRFGALHLPEPARKELTELVERFLEEHGVYQGDDMEHWEYVLMAFRAEEE